ncbi:hypothetical protein NHH03_00300 [Stieleria sp. TO1_6]|uniref:hypothetical protein n=1 Tax=Stieleria tagensis TaxID=2956795 RepID=UPI00209AB476|nr:hypothetical protein [Stieleria tagensis]MCO8120160.1 hypothetical protein [Stieleria tagensis]
MTNRSIFCFAASALLCLALSFAARPTTAGPPWLQRIVHPLAGHGKKPATCQDNAVETLAENIDWLEHQIDRYGTIVAKSPDVWGEARLTKYRQEVEQQLSDEVGQFDENRLSGASFVRDQALLAAAVGVGSGTNAPDATNLLGTSQQTSISIDMQNDPLVGGFGLSSDSTSLFAGALKLEQTAVLDQHKRYLDHLSELRRINEGDDTSDSPGYSINLVRLPISVLPGTYSKQGHGAEITVSASMQLGEDLLPSLYRDLVVNDLIDQLALPLTRFLNSDPQFVSELLDHFQRYEQTIGKLNALLSTGYLVTDDPELIDYLIAKANENGLDITRFEFFRLMPNAFVVQGRLDFQSAPRFIDEFNELVGYFEKLEHQVDSQKHAGMVQRQPSDTELVPAMPMVMSVSDHAYSNAKRQFQQISDTYGSKQPTVDESEALDQAPERNAAQSLELPVHQIQELTAGLKNFLASESAIVSDGNSLTRRSQMPVPPTQLIEVYGIEALGHLAVESHRAFRRNLLNREIVHITDMQSFLREEIQAAYEMLSRPPMQHLWTSMDVSGDALPFSDLVRLRREQEIAQRRQWVMDQLADDQSHRASETLVWGIYVLSRLLNDRLIDDMQQYQIDQVCGVEPSQWLTFYGPDPSPQARDAFNAYVTARWPLKIFTIDPMVTEQNIADSASIYRQMQFATAIAVASGEIGANGAMRFVRQLQRDMATIDVNRTVVGFAHGEDTFGWRFYPRFQTAAVQNNAVTLLRDLVVGGPTDRQLLRERELEPGMRECIAVILAPSFISGVTLDTRTNWFRLDKPSHSALSMKQITELSRAITQMRIAAETCISRPDLYRGGETDRMLRRVAQLDRELPLQTLSCQIPESNTLGGFEIFSSGTRELGPELLGWYGSPGYDPDVDDQVFFLVGDNFSVHETKLIAGTKAPKSLSLLSRQIMQVTLPRGLPVVDDERLGIVYQDRDDQPQSVNSYRGFIDAHVATPYGVSGHLLIPVIRKDHCGCDTNLCAPVLANSSATVIVPLKIKDDAYVPAAPLITPDGGLAIIDVAAGNGLTSNTETATITLHPMHAGNQLPPIVFEDVTSVGTSYSIGLPQLVSAVGTSGTLTKSLGAYMAWLCNAVQASGKDATPIFENDTELTVTATIALGDGPTVPVQGESKLLIKTVLR